MKTPNQCICPYYIVYVLYVLYRVFSSYSSQVVLVFSLDHGFPRDVSMLVNASQMMSNITFLFNA